MPVKSGSLVLNKTNIYLNLFKQLSAGDCFFDSNGFYTSYPDYISYNIHREMICLPSIEKLQKSILFQTLYRIVNNKVDTIDLSNSILYRVPSMRTRVNNNRNLFFFYSILFLQRTVTSLQIYVTIK
uniref:Uncharacterized protein n=1 Tax=Cacopsylla melanoneura TaxID=428564 RepID=A0A8D9BFD1_9HEMI